jgi:cyclohexanecarboxyl-CoA dehydrogenase
MLDFSFSEDQIMMRTMVRDFAIKEIVPGYKERIKNKTVPRELIKKMAEIGLLGMNVSEKYGGQPQAAVTAGIVCEELAKYAEDAALVVSYTLGQAAFLEIATEEVKAEWLPAMVRGEKMVLVAATEADAGSDLGNLKMIARKDGDYYILNGEKNRVSYGYLGNSAIVLTKTESNSKRITAFLVPLDLPGINKTPIEDMGVESTCAAIVSFEDVRLHRKYLLGDDEGKGFMEMMRNFDYNRVFLSLMALGKAEISLEETCEYVKQRVQFGKPLAKFQGVSFKLAEAATYLELGKWMCYRTLWMKDHGQRHSRESAMVKWFCPKIATEIIHQCLLTHGHYGYSKDLPFEQRYRDTIGQEIGDGTAEVMKLIIARDMLGKDFTS